MSQPRIKLERKFQDITPHEDVEECASFIETVIDHLCNPELLREVTTVFIRLTPEEILVLRDMIKGTHTASEELRRIKILPEK